MKEENECGGNIMLSFLAISREQDQGKNESTALKKLGLIVTDNSVAKALYNQIIKESKVKDLRDDIAKIFEQLKISLPITITGFADKQITEKIRNCQHYEHKNIKGQAYSFKTEGKDAILYVSEHYEIAEKIEISVSTDGKNFKTISKGGTPKIFRMIHEVYQYETMLDIIYMEKVIHNSYVWKYFSDKKNINIMISAYSNTQLRDFEELSSMLRKENGNFSQILSIVKKYAKAKKKLYTTYATVELFDKNESNDGYTKSQIINLESGKTVEHYIQAEDYTLNWSNNEVEEFELISDISIPDNTQDSKRVATKFKCKYSVKLYYNKYKGYTLEINGLVKSIDCDTDEFGILKLIKQAEDKIEQHLAGSNPKDTVLNIKNTAYSLDFYHGTKYTLNYKAPGISSLGNNFPVVKHNIIYNNATGWKIFMSKVIDKTEMEKFKGIGEMIKKAKNVIENNVKK